MFRKIFFRGGYTIWVMLSSFCLLFVGFEDCEISTYVFVKGWIIFLTSKTVIQFLFDFVFLNSFLYCPLGHNSKEKKMIAITICAFKFGSAMCGRMSNYTAIGESLFPVTTGYNLTKTLTIISNWICNIMANVLRIKR